MAARESSTKTHAMRAQIELRQRILNGDLGGGMRLFEVPLAEDLEISRTPLREAMSRLAEEGLLERARQGGFIVRSFGYSDVVDAIELRGVMEGTAARLAAERGVAPERMVAIRETLARLDGCFGTTPDQTDFEDYSELNVDFHAQLAGLSGSDIVCREVARASQLPFASPSAFTPDETAIDAFRRSLISAHEQHHALIRAIAGREGARAEFLAREHARVARRNLEYVIDGDRSLRSSIPGHALIVR